MVIDHMSVSNVASTAMRMMMMVVSVVAVYVQRTYFDQRHHFI
jgi:hypothetical protein